MVRIQPKMNTNKIQYFEAGGKLGRGYAWIVQKVAQLLSGVFHRTGAKESTPKIGMTMTTEGEEMRLTV
jgi:hypothetical protein